MGIFNRKKLMEADPSFITEEMEYISEQLKDEGIQMQLMAMMTFIAILYALRMVSSNLVKGLGGEHVLSIHGEYQKRPKQYLQHHSSLPLLSTHKCTILRPE